jgi:replicative DNA helicase
LLRLERDDFSNEAHRVVFDAIAKRLEAGERPTCALLANDVHGSGVPASEVFRIFDEAGPSVVPYFRILRDARLRRMLHSLGACLTAHAGDAAREPCDVVRWLHRQVEHIDAVEARR